MAEARVRQQYDKLATIYDTRWQSYISNTLSFLKTWADISPQETVLDVACGTGEFERLILSENPLQQMVGVDISESMLAIAKQKCSSYPQLSFYNASAASLPFANDSFDVIVSASSFHYFDNPNTVLQEMRRVLKPNGRLIILDWCRDYLSCKLLDIILRIIDPAYKGCYNQNELHHLLTTADLSIRRSKRVRFGILWGLMIVTGEC
ncbi:class I SAM-dependent methyltransferase [Nostoc sp. TCL26-01]|uniref:class I SAM-dependent methyltransferase n=1 Tax=Nostoc sp. TCL26-01 TaxID=2576904 RepID=UPI0015BF3088|nr:methyltransferase domain-containing protein [Nostoc sp. TCL26-01]QLE56817.1 methyltransferase domain-containing protein [Nostoc sp. TCL26-01]